MGRSALELTGSQIGRSGDSKNDHGPTTRSPTGARTGLDQNDAAMVGLPPGSLPTEKSLVEACRRTTDPRALLKSASINPHSMCAYARIARGSTPMLLLMTILSRASLTPALGKVASRAKPFLRPFHCIEGASARSCEDRLHNGLGRLQIPTQPCSDKSTHLQLLPDAACDRVSC